MTRLDGAERAPDGSPEVRLITDHRHHTVASDRGTQMPYPGLILRDQCLTPNGVSVTNAANALGVDRQTLSNLLNGRSGISPEMALRLEKAFGVSARTWMERDGLRTGRRHGPRS
jgi:addiction module HigA family antidote